jgi:hypothetical protein
MGLDQQHFNDRGYYDYIHLLDRILNSVDPEGKAMNFLSMRFQKFITSAN